MKEVTSQASDNWHKDFFTDLYWQLFMKRSPENIALEVNAIEKAVNGLSINSVLDVCCGMGEVAHELSQRKNIEAYGIEYSEDYVKNNFLKNIIQGDARMHHLHRKFSLVLNWYSSFFYFNKEDNKRILKHCYDYCDNVFLLETANSAHTLFNLNKEIQYEKEHQGTTYSIKRSSRVNLQENILEQDWFIDSRDVHQIHQTKSYLYFPKDIKDILLEIGFSKVDIFGFDNYQMTDLDLNNKRILIKALV